MGNRELARKLEDLNKKFDGQILTLYEMIEQVMARPSPPRRAIGLKAVTEGSPLPHAVRSP